jgi:broad specificity phosphatase PhoE
MANRNEAPEVIMFVRHGEKPGEGSPPHGVNYHGEIDEHSLTVLGWTRAGALAGLFAHAPFKSHPHVVRPGRVFATRPTHEAKSKREMHTATPTAKRLKIDIVDSHTHGNEEDLVKEVLGRPESALIVWHHGTMSKLVNHFPIVNIDEVPKHWPDERFDLIWVLVRQPGAEPKYRFVVVPQMLLADDKETV